MIKKEIFVNLGDNKSIIKAEKLKTRLENEGFKYIIDIQTGLETFKFVYTKD